ncbi:hypothetical protein EKL02_13675 [Janthinobacterium sp. 17J80-10]|nr:hypothetical protein EKL02_13675 [Janthinobacterium sp. 17J80-10]
MSTTLSTLRKQYPVLLTLDQLAQILQRSPTGLRETLCSSRANWAQQINSTKVYIGRRLYFRTEDIARLIDEEFSKPES